MSWADSKCKAHCSLLSLFAVTPPLIQALPLECQMRVIEDSCYGLFILSIYHIGNSAVLLWGCLWVTTATVVTRTSQICIFHHVKNKFVRLQPCTSVQRRIRTYFTVVWTTSALDEKCFLFSFYPKLLVPIEFPDRSMHFASQIIEKWLQKYEFVLKDDILVLVDVDISTDVVFPEV